MSVANRKALEGIELAVERETAEARVSLRRAGATDHEVREAIIAIRNHWRRHPVLGDAATQVLGPLEDEG